MTHPGTARPAGRTLAKRYSRRSNPRFPHCTRLRATEEFFNVRQRGVKGARHNSGTQQKWLGWCGLRSRTTPSLALVPIPPVAAAAVARSSAKISSDHRLGFINSQGSTLKLRAIHLGYGLVCILLSQFDKGEALRSARISISDKSHRVERTKLFKRSTDIVFCRLKRQISNKQFFRHFYLSVRELPELSGGD
jgi:hypothetical protein